MNASPFSVSRVIGMWYTMRAALSAEARTHYTFYTLPAVTGCGVIALDEP